MPRRATSTKRTSKIAGPSERLSPVVEDGGEIEMELSPEPPARPPVMRAPPPPSSSSSSSAKARAPPWYMRRPKWLRLMEESMSA